MSVKEFDPPLDAGIKRIVETLYKANVETFESCEGGDGHAYLEPTVRFHGDRSEGYRAFAIAIQSGLGVRELRRVYTVSGSELEGPWWEMTFKSHQGLRGD
jgi:hypothetical protein